MNLKSSKPKSTKKRILFVSLALVAVVGIVCTVTTVGRARRAREGVACEVLKKTDLRDTVSVSGVIQSRNSHSVYSTMTYPVAKVSVSVGDAVKKGDILAVLDTSSLEKDMEQQKATMSTSNASAALAVQQASDSYETALDLYNHGQSPDIVSASSQLDSAKSALQTEQDTYNATKFSYDNGQVSKTEMNAESAKLSQAKKAVTNAQKTLDAAKKKAQQDLRTAQSNYQDAVNKAADKSQQAALEKIQKSLDDCIITAPADGTVTVCDAAVGAVPNGVLFKVEDPASLEVDTQVKEIDVDSVKPGSKATVTTDATGDAAAAASVTSVAPAATQSTQGTGDVTFDAKVAVTGQNPSLRIGMTARVSIVLQEKSSVFAVPYDALLQKPDGSYVLMAAEKSGSLYKVREIPVKTGLETDVSVEISGEGLKDGLTYVSSPESVSAGDAVQPGSSPSSSVSEEG